MQSTGFITIEFLQKEQEKRYSVRTEIVKTQDIGFIREWFVNDEGFQLVDGTYIKDVVLIEFDGKKDKNGEVTYRQLKAVGTMKHFKNVLDAK